MGRVGCPSESARAATGSSGSARRTAGREGPLVQPLAIAATFRAAEGKVCCGGHRGHRGQDTARARKERIGQATGQVGEHVRVSRVERAQKTSRR